MFKSTTKNIGGVFLSAICLASGFSAEAQQPKTLSRIGLLIAGSRTGMSASIGWFRDGLRELGYIEGENILIEERYADAELDRLSSLAAELLRLKVEVVVTAGTPGVRAWTKVTKTIPIVFVGAGDPVASGIVASLARPGGNVTGISQFGPELGGKRLEILKEAFPKVTRVAYLWTPDLLGSASGLRGSEIAAPALGVKLQSLPVRTSNDIDGAFAAALKERAQALTAQTAPILNTYKKRVIEFAAKHRLPAIYNQAEWAEAGGLMSYGPNPRDQLQRVAIFVDKILKGAKAADLPVEQPVKFEMVVNLKTAKQIGLTIPANVLRWADEVIK